MRQSLAHFTDKVACPNKYFCTALERWESVSFWQLHRAILARAIRHAGLPHRIDMRASSLLVGLLLCAAGVAMAAEPVTVLGLSLGGKLKMPIRQCATREIGTDAKSLCWLGEPFDYKGSKSGSLIVPGTDTRPKWAAYGSFNVSIAKDGTLRSVGVKTSRAEEFVEILNSITGRFGQSKRETQPGASIDAATWDRPDIHIELVCSRSFGCNTKFSSGAEHAEHMRELAARKAKDAARPASP